MTVQTFLGKGKKTIVSSNFPFEEKCFKSVYWKMENMCLKWNVLRRCYKDKNRTAMGGMRARGVPLNKQ